jgi:hypothetical protein
MANFPYILLLISLALRSVTGFESNEKYFRIVDYATLEEVLESPEHLTIRILYRKGDLD